MTKVSRSWILFLLILLSVPQTAVADSCILGLLTRFNSRLRPQVDATAVDPLKKGKKYPTMVSMQQKYVAEETGLNPQLPRSMWPSRSPPQVEYLASKKKREPYRLHVRDGLFYNSMGQTVDSNARVLSFVMDESGNIFGRQGNVGYFFHSSFFAGKPVAAAGEIIFDEGKILKISSNSGHYQPKPENFVQALKEIQSRGIILSEKQISFEGTGWDAETRQWVLQRLQVASDR